MKFKTLTKSDFAIGEPIVVEAVIDTSCGWEFDAPLHIMRPFHHYAEIGSVGWCAVERAIEDIIIDFDIEGEIVSSNDWWPYQGQPYVDGLLRRCRLGRGRKGVWYGRGELTFSHFGSPSDNDMSQYELKCLVGCG